MVVGLGVVVVILVGLPLAAVGTARLWRDPPAPQRAPAASPELADHQRRIALGVTHGQRKRAADRAIRTGITAPPELRAAVRELVAGRVADIDRRLPRAGRRCALLIVMALLVLAAATWMTVRGSGSFLYAYAALWAVYAWQAGPPALRRRQARARAALTANQ